MEKENKEVTERMREDILAEQAEMDSAIADIRKYAEVRLEVLRYRIRVSMARFNIPEIADATEERVRDGLYPVIKELNNRLEDL